MPQHITSLAGLAPFNRDGQIMAYSMDGGTTWEYVKMLGLNPQYFRDGSYGYPANHEVSSEGVHHYHPLRGVQFADGMIVRPATADEIKDKKWSYDH